MTERRQIKRLIIIALLTLIIGLIARETFNFREVAVNIMLENVEPPDMIDQSILIIRSHLEGRSGTDRYISDSGELAVDSLWRIRVDQVLKGDAPSRDIIVRSDGGRFLLTHIDVQPTVKFNKDTDMLLFLESANQQSDFRVVGSIQGNYRIEMNNAGVEIAVQQDSNTSMPLAEIIDLIKTK